MLQLKFRFGSVTVAEKLILYVAYEEISVHNYVGWSHFSAHPYTIDLLASFEVSLNLDNCLGTLKWLALNGENEKSFFVQSQ